ncbi:bifunctional 2-polyprenyl-6-hydroxyphenol methylase/3-demethylubiquinol 3-O-methyltransferase UbiG [Halalkalicoccus sp. NIPERK01]|uniref:class I SAM-dependent methyltransferase n=1 Tax=Halalkalicoccus sp. NIPERK01 TaxID=3053469 RepID=UPI00256F011C|nr:class I SAM-dependent methyltransferase [Halalkalicoccus sp. NIPERK01]MDL5362874.1 class I SAM-dependent methyltransferase [Halalkalicoccus sp. NIPERK01]
MADAFGRMVEDFHRDRSTERPVYRRDDGRVSEAHLEGYFADYDEWSDLEKRMVERVSGSVLDVGCGVGRTALWARREGHAVCGVDRSPGAIRVARVTEPGGRLVADLDNPTRPDGRAEPECMAERTVEDGLAYRRFRVEYDGRAGPWTDLLMASPAVLRGVVGETAWTVEELVEGETSAYAVVLSR